MKLLATCALIIGLAGCGQASSPPPDVQVPAFDPKPVEPSPQQLAKAAVSRLDTRDQRLLGEILKDIAAGDALLHSVKGNQFSEFTGGEFDLILWVSHWRHYKRNDQPPEYKWAADNLSERAFRQLVILQPELRRRCISTITGIMSGRPIISRVREMESLIGPDPWFDQFFASQAVDEQVVAALVLALIKAQGELNR